VTRTAAGDPTAPPYARIAAELRRRIEAGELSPGDRLPSTRDIARTWKVAIATATRALAVLQAEGWIVAQTGVGTLVAERPRRDARRGGRAPADPTLRRATVVQTAIAIADAEGLTAVSMRSVAAELGVPTMSLYRHVAGKDELVMWMTDAVFAEIPVPTTSTDDWRARLMLSARLQWSAFRRHPWLAQLISITRPQPLPHLLAHGEWALAALAGLGLPATTMLEVHVTVFSYVRGLAVNLEWEAEAEATSGLTEQEWMDRQTPAFDELANSGAYPTFARMLAGLSDSFDLDLDRLFELGLTALLDGLAPRLTAPPADGS